MDNPVNTFTHTVPSSLPSEHRVRRGCLTRLPHTRLGRLARQATQKAFLSTLLNYLGLRLYGPLGNCKTPSGRIKPMIPRAWGVIISQFQVRDDSGRARVLRHRLREDSPRILLRPKRRKLQLNLRQVRMEYQDGKGYGVSEHLQGPW